MSIFNVNARAIRELNAPGSSKGRVWSFLISKCNHHRTHNFEKLCLKNKRKKQHIYENSRMVLQKPKENIHTLKYKHSSCNNSWIVLSFRCIRSRLVFNGCCSLNFKAWIFECLRVVDRTFEECVFIIYDWIISFGHNCLNAYVRPSLLQKDAREKMIAYVLSLFHILRHL